MFEVFSETAEDFFGELYNSLESILVQEVELTPEIREKVLALEFPENDYDAVVAYTVELQSILPEGSAERIRVDQIYNYLHGDMAGGGVRELRTEKALRGLQILVDSLRTQTA